jgi:hypothetical protein
MESREVRDVIAHQRARDLFVEGAQDVWRKEQLGWRAG